MGKTREMHTDHIFPYRVVLAWRKKGFVPKDTDPNTRENLMILCNSCHAIKTQVELSIFKGDLYSFTTEHVKFCNEELMRTAFTKMGVQMLGAGI